MLLPEDVFLELVLRSDSAEIQKLCSSNRYYNALCKAHSEYISKKQLEKNGVNYTDPHANMYLVTGTNYSRKRSYHDMYKLYLKSLEKKVKEQAMKRSKKWLLKRHDRLREYSINELIDHYNIAFNKNESYNPNAPLMNQQNRIVDLVGRIFPPTAPRWVYRD